jgi:hypothetical protein
MAHHEACVAVSFCSRASGRKRDASCMVLYRDNMHVWKRGSLRRSFSCTELASGVVSRGTWPRADAPHHRSVRCSLHVVVCTDNGLFVPLYYGRAYACITTVGCIWLDDSTVASLMVF